MRRATKITLVVASLTMLATAVWVGSSDRSNSPIVSNQARILFFLKDLSSAQELIKASGAIDCDKDGAGEYGFLGELSGDRTLRGSGKKREASRYKPREGELSYVGQGIYRIHGYYLRVYLPGKGRQLRYETDPLDRNPSLPVDADLAESYWWCLAWPVRYGTTGKLSYFVSDHGDVLLNNDRESPYSGMDKVPAGDAASSPDRRIHRPWAGYLEGLARDGQRWSIVG